MGALPALLASTLTPVPWSLLHVGRYDVLVCTCVFGPFESVSVASCCSWGPPVGGQTALVGALWRVFASSCLGGCLEPLGGGLGTGSASCWRSWEMDSTLFPGGCPSLI